MRRTTDRDNQAPDKKNSIIAPIVVGVMIALVAGSTAPWWWSMVFKDHHPPKITTLQRIKRGDSFHVLLLNNFGDLAAGQTYFATYNRKLETIVVTGFAATVNKPNITNSSSCRNIDDGRINLWGHPFLIKDDQLIDSSAGASGKIEFDSDDH